MSAQDNALETLSQSEVENQDTQGAAQPEPLLGYWPQEAMLMRYTQLGSGEYFNICHLDQLRSGLSDCRKALNLPISQDCEQVNYGVLRALHCVHFAEMSPPVRMGIQSAVQGVLGLDQEIGVALFGQDRWLKANQLLEQNLAAHEHSREPQSDALGEKHNIGLSPWLSFPSLLLAFLLGLALATAGSIVIAHKSKPSFEAIYPPGVEPAMPAAPPVMMEIPRPKS
ncbi:hypothetical protein [Pseudomonas aeruginosa]|uniref:hypothetical protein n=1 Tax=Pseudomonas aeruginosa TaxID=287 RepID=UPI001114F2BC|nr:hypothetical protein [Pseudomonas aeruginosa]